MGSFTFSTQRRLTDKAAFERVYKNGRRFHQSLFQGVACPNELGHARLGLSIAAKAVGNAVSRNRIRRQIREVFRHAQATLPPVDLIVSSRNQARTATAAELRSDLERLLELVRKKCGPSSSPSSTSTAG